MTTFIVVELYDLVSFDTRHVVVRKPLAKAQRLERFMNRNSLKIGGIYEIKGADVQDALTNLQDFTCVVRSHY